MSDSVTNVQIEDVLSSIRKLVSEEVRAQTRDARTNARQANGAGDTANGGEASSQPEPDDRLLLTPALRVQPSATGTAPVDGDEAPFTHAEDDHEEADLLDLMDRVRSAGAQAARPEFKRPVGIAAVKRPAPAEPDQPASEDAIRAALFALGDTDLGMRDLDDGDDAAEASGDTEEPRDLPKFLHRSGVTSLGQRIADVEAAVSTSGGEWEPEADEEAEAAPDPAAASVPWEDIQPEEEPETPQQVARGYDAGISGDWAVASDPTERDFLDNPMDTASMPSIADDDLVAMAPEAVEDEVVPGDAAEDAHAAAFDPVDQTTEEPIHFDTDAALAVEDDVAAEEVGIQDDDNADDFEDDFGDMDTEEPAQERETIVHRSSSSYDVYDDDRETLAADDPTLIDEEMLRDLVAEIVRQELQGALGERITRNVRKLVRREIHRALSAQELR